MTFRRFLAFALLLLIVGSVNGQWLKDQAVTYAHFGYVHSVTSSISHVYFATTNGIIKYDKMRNEWGLPLTGTDGLDDQEVLKVRVDRFDRKLNAETNISVYRFDDLFGRWFPIPDWENVENDDRHVSSYDYLLPEFDANYMGDGRFMDIYSRMFSITDAIDDGSGYLWFGTWGFGPGKARTANGLTDLLPYGLLQDNVGVILPDDSLLWFGGPLYNEPRPGITALNRNTGEFFQLESGLRADFPAADVNCLAADEQHLYVGTPNGLYLLNKESWRSDGLINRRGGLLDDNVLSLSRVDNSLYVGTAAGLNLLNLDNDSVYNVYTNTFSNARIYDLAPVNGTIWIASSVGAYRYSPKAQTLQRYQDEDLVLFSRVWSIEHAGSDTWLISDNGLVRLNRTTGESESFPDRMDAGVYRPLAANQWVAAYATNFGLTLLFVDRDKPYTAEFSERDGLASNTILSLELDGEYLWIGTDRGVTRFLWDNPNRAD